MVPLCIFATMLVVTESQDRLGDRGLQATGASIEVSGRIVAGIASCDTSGTGERKQFPTTGFDMTVALPLFRGFRAVIGLKYGAGCDSRHAYGALAAAALAVCIRSSWLGLTLSLKKVASPFLGRLSGRVD